MRGDDLQQQAMFSYISPEARVPKDHPLRPIQIMVDNALFELAPLCRAWLVLALNSPVGREYFARSSKQTTNLASINMTQLKNFLIPVPPTEEQKRIVTKVDQLMTLCDKLEAKFNQTQQHSEKLMIATVRQLLVA